MVANAVDSYQAVRRLRIELFQDSSWGRGSIFPSALTLTTRVDAVAGLCRGDEHGKNFYQGLHMNPGCFLRV